MRSFDRKKFNKFFATETKFMAVFYILTTKKTKQKGFRGRKSTFNKEASSMKQIIKNMGQNMSCDGNESWFLERNLCDKTAIVNEIKKSTVCEATTHVPYKKVISLAESQAGQHH